jgi:hypothetical protein
MNPERFYGAANDNFKSGEDFLDEEEKMDFPSEQRDPEPEDFQDPISAAL